jgi:molybdenum-dependent DNA-binding transcriptional regulator ModE
LDRRGNNRGTATLNDMLRPTEYLERAEEAEAKAETVRDYDAKQTYLEIAKQWRELAKLAEQQGY